MRPKIAMWSDYGAPRHKHWRTPSRRSRRSSIGPKILVAAVVVVAGVIGISGIYPQIIDSEWVQGPSPHSQRVAQSEPTPTTRALRHRCGDSVAAAPYAGDHRRGRRTGTGSDAGSACTGATPAAVRAATACSGRCAGACGCCACAGSTRSGSTRPRIRPGFPGRPRRRCVRRSAPPPNSRRPIRMPRSPSPTFRTPRPRPIRRPIPPLLLPPLRRQPPRGRSTPAGRRW